MQNFAGMVVSTVVPAVVFAFLAAIIITPMVLKHRRHQAVVELARAAASRGEPLSPEVLDKLVVERPPPQRTVVESDLRTGALLVAIALAFCVLSFTIVTIEGDRDAYAIMAIAAFPGLIGATKLLFGVIGMRRRVH